VNPVQELDNAGNIVANLLTGLNIDEVFTRTASSTTRTLLGDALNSTLALADNAGAVQTTYTYEPFGTSSVTGQSNTNSYQYTGRENDGIGLDYYRARYFSPSRQRFISEDPIGFAAGDPNLYGYVFNRPTSFTDSSGEAVDPVSWTALGIVCGGGAVLGVVATWAVAGRKPTLSQMGSGAVMGCGAATIGLVSWVAAGGAAGVAVLTNSIKTAPIAPTVGQLDQFRRQLAQNGEASLLKSQRSFEKLLVEHQAKLREIEALGGDPGSVEREIRNFRQQIEAIKQVLAK
jgi:RHS repeat-associated protein